jgi:hypothetical protein
MLRKIYAMLSKNTHFVYKTLDYEALMVARNAPRWLQMLVKHGSCRLQPETLTNFGCLVAPGRDRGQDHVRPEVGFFHVKY